MNRKEDPLNSAHKYMYIYIHTLYIHMCIIHVYAIQCFLHYYRVQKDCVF